MRLTWLTCTLFLAVVLGGCGLSEEALQQLANANAAYLAGDNAGVIHETDAFLTHHGRSGRAGEAYYLRGAARYGQAKSRGGEPEHLDPTLSRQARADLEQAVARSGGDLRGKASLTLGHLAFDTDEIPLADRMFRQAIDSVGKDPVMGSEAMFRLGCTLQRQGKWRDADVWFQKTMFQFPGSGPAQASIGRVNALAWTVQAGSFATRENADRAMTTLTGNDATLPARTTAILDARPRYVVHVGRFATHEDAQTMRRRVQTFQPDAFVTVTK